MTITFSNDYATIRNFMKDGDVDTSKRQLSLSGKGEVFAPMPWEIKGEDVALAPTREDLAEMERAATVPL